MHLWQKAKKILWHFCKRKMILKVNVCKIGSFKWVALRGKENFPIINICLEYQRKHFTISLTTDFLSKNAKDCSCWPKVWGVQNKLFLMFFLSWICLGTYLVTIPMFVKRSVKRALSCGEPFFTVQTFHFSLWST